MGLKRRNRVSPNFSMASMTDVIFLLLIFFMITSTVVSPNAIKVLLPQGKQQTSAKPLTRVVIDKDLSLPRNLRLFTDGIKTLVFTSGKHVPEGEVEYITIDFSKPVVPAILQFLYEKKIQSLIVEGGRYTLQSFIDSEYWDEAHIEIGKQVLKAGIPSPVISGTKVAFEKHGNSEIIKVINR